MPRKKPRPAAKKARDKLKERMAQGRRYERKAAPYLDEPRFGDGLLLSALAMSIFGKRGA